MTRFASSKGRRLAGLAAAVSLGCHWASCDAVDREFLARTCDPERGCVNSAFIAAVETSCGNQPSCMISIHDAFPSAEKVYFVQSGAARLEDCTAIPVAPSIRRTYYPLCQYVLLEERGRVSTYLRGHCVDVKVTGDELAVNPTHIGNVSVIDPRTRIEVGIVRERDSLGREQVLRQLDPPPRSLAPFVADKCVGR